MTTAMTVEGARKLREELESLRVGRAEISKAIGEARKLGDLSENADYHAAKERQGLTEARIRFLESKLADAQIIDIKKLKNVDSVVFGSTVTLENLDTQQTIKYQIVGELESDVPNGKISNVSPLARAMIGKQQYDVFDVGVGENKKEYSIEKIEIV